MLEKELERYFVRRCKELGLLTYKFVSPANRGVPDRLVIYGGQVTFFELKRAGKSLTTLQQHTKKLFEEHGAKVFVVDSKETIDDLLGYLLWD